MGLDDRPADILIRGWSAGSDACPDIMATYVLQAATMERCIMDQAVARKLHAYGKRFEGRGAVGLYIPFPMFPPRDIL